MVKIKLFLAVIYTVVKTKQFLVITYTVYKKPGKIYYCSTFRGHRDSIIKRLVK